MKPQARQARSISLCPRASLKCSRHSESFSGITRFMPRYSTLGISAPYWDSPRRAPRLRLVGPVSNRTSVGTRASVVHDESGAGGWHGPAEVHGDPTVLDLAAPTRRVIVAVLSLGRAGAVVVHAPAELAHVLDDHAHAVRIALAEVAARSVVGPPAAQLDDPARHVRSALALLAEAVLLELEHGREGEGVVGAGDAHVLGCDPGLAEDDVLGVVAGHPRDGARGPVEVGTRLADPSRHPHDVGGLLLEVARALGGGDDDAGGIVRLHAAVEQVEGLADPSRAEHVLDGDALLQARLGVLGRVLAVGDPHAGDLK